MGKRGYIGIVTRECEKCGKAVTRKASAFKMHVFCDRACYLSSEYHSSSVRVANAGREGSECKAEVTCMQCGVVLLRYRTQHPGKRAFCSRECGKLYSLDQPVRQINSGGYAKVYIGKGEPGADTSGHILEHRHFMQRHLGRALLPLENVHHVNGVRDDNRLENLELWTSSQPSGQRVEDKLAWARQIIAEYEGMLF